MNQSKRIFDVAKLTAEELEQRRIGIDVLFQELQKSNAALQIKDAEYIFDKMQQAAIDSGVSSWTHYRMK